MSSSESLTHFTAAGTGAPGARIVGFRRNGVHERLLEGRAMPAGSQIYRSRHIMAKGVDASTPISRNRTSRHWSNASLPRSGFGHPLYVGWQPFRSKGERGEKMILLQP